MGPPQTICPSTGILSARRISAGSHCRTPYHNRPPADGRFGPWHKVPTVPRCQGGLRVPLRTELVVIQPTSRCNLNCVYCYLPNRRVGKVMPHEILEATINKVLGSRHVYDRIEFIWHAGEPLLAGTQFYERALHVMAANNRRNLTITNVVQTNATLIDSRWAHFLATHGFRVGVSLDGPAFLHDKQRQTWSGRGSVSAGLR
ncbi:radical SAM protein, partial [Geodermatophilus obscurus]|uniref:radical SAM protein n=1 Tax=Geodermatophilus obscurus TaxID=1861 RepID=UPI003D79266D